MNYNNLELIGQLKFWLLRREIVQTICGFIHWEFYSDPYVSLDDVIMHFLLYFLQFSKIFNVPITFCVNMILGIYIRMRYAY